MNREPLDPITDEAVAAYLRDGAVALRRVFDGEWIALLADGVARNIAEPSRFAHVYSTKGAPGFFFGDYCSWERIEEYRSFVFDSPAALVAQRMMGSTKVNFFHEHVLVKEPGTVERTPWHHDQPYWTVDGDQVCIAFHALTVHGAPGNPSATTNRRAIALRWTGDDARFARRDGYMSPPFEEVALAPGAAMDCETFPVVLPRP